MVVFEIDSNVILVESMRNRTSGEMVKSYQTFGNRLKEQGFEPKMHVLDNECSAEFKEAIAKNGMEYQPVPPHNHLRNIVKKALQTFKDPFVAVLCETNVTFLMQLWCQLAFRVHHLHDPIDQKVKSSFDRASSSNSLQARGF